MSQAGRLIAIEGIDGCGKSTQAGLLAEALGALSTREPGATDLGRALRALVLDPSGPPAGARAEALLMAADRAQHVDEMIGPALAAGRWVVTDRFSGSTLAYQGWGRGLDPEALGPVVAWAAGGVVPDLSILVDVDPDLARQRLEAPSPPGAPGNRADRMEARGAAFFTRVRAGFLAQAHQDPGRWVVVDGSPPVAQVAAAIRAIVHERLGEPR